MVLLLVRDACSLTNTCINSCSWKRIPSRGPAHAMVAQVGPSCFLPFLLPFFHLLLLLCFNWICKPMRDSCEVPLASGPNLVAGKWLPALVLVATRHQEFSKKLQETPKRVPTSPGWLQNIPRHPRIVPRRHHNGSNTAHDT